TYDNHAAEVQRRSCIDGWRRHGVELSDRCIGIDGWSLLLVDSASGGTAPESSAWLQAQPHERAMLLTHVPVDRPLVRSFIADVDSERDCAIYTQSRSPALFADHLAGRIRTVFTGHLHFPGLVRDGDTTFHLLDASFARGSRGPSVAIVDTGGGSVRVTSLTAPV
ncbi:MAG: hypothetical protein H0V44_14420, partial [Planctomycetes bacterium]|nr:hypothetical protein [Planctomycetota bacterium]